MLADHCFVCHDKLPHVAATGIHGSGSNRIYRGSSRYKVTFWSCLRFRRFYDWHVVDPLFYSFAAASCCRITESQKGTLPSLKSRNDSQRYGLVFICFFFFFAPSGSCAATHALRTAVYWSQKYFPKRNFKIQLRDLHSLWLTSRSRSCTCEHSASFTRLYARCMAKRPSARPFIKKFSAINYQTTIVLICIHILLLLASWYSHGKGGNIFSQLDDRIVSIIHIQHPCALLCSPYIY